ncbi:nitrate reductase subunit beta [Clostridium paridis]|uniref:Nitrate reductase subunit beta n=1 Tax=Clostridium paridis TaxID=2803863 RepID=A0A937FH58_9CLOT|nr:nitrate reductase subunit beta [Clostridium paridis]MBL4933304.1 nitrate reductase subunit beta [Clostridium paridis]
MRIKAQFAMVMNLDKCIGCHTCSISCKNVWTNRQGAEHMWWNNVETKPGIGYPREWENQEKYKGGWKSVGGKLVLRAGSRPKVLAKTFYNPNLPVIDDYYEPWSYEYEKLMNEKDKKSPPSARPISSLTGKHMDIKWGPNWEDDLAGVYETGKKDSDMYGVEEGVLSDFKKVFMMYLPRICEHCLNPSCAAACPSGAIYKRDEDGIVLVDQNLCRSWRLCVSACPYKKTYYNWNSFKADKCVFCFPRVEAGLPTLCAESCVGRLRYIGVILYDADSVGYAASVKQNSRAYNAHLNVILDPNDEDVIKQARKDGIPEAWIDAAKISPIYKLAVKWRIAFPPHPEYRTLPMVWYVPPLSPILKTINGEERISDIRKVFPTIENMRIPIHYLANLLTDGEDGYIQEALKKMAAMRYHMRAVNLGIETDKEILKENGLTEESAEEMYRLLAISKYRDRFVIPSNHREIAEDLLHEQGTCGIDLENNKGPYINC